jgi:hypothetical protein
MKYQVSISGWVNVEVEAASAAEAEEKALQTPLGGSLYDYVIEETTEVKA